VKRLAAYLRGLLRDVLFLRVCTAIYGIPFAALGLLGLLKFRPEAPAEWFIVLALFALAALGVFMVYASFFGQAGLVERASGGVADGGELIGIVLVLLVVAIAIPITALLRTVRRAQQ